MSFRTAFTPFTLCAFRSASALYSYRSTLPVKVATPSSTVAFTSLYCLPSSFFWISSVILFWSDCAGEPIPLARAAGGIARTAPANSDIHVIVPERRIVLNISTSSIRAARFAMVAAARGPRRLTDFRCPGTSHLYRHQMRGWVAKLRDWAKIPAYVGITAWDRTGAGHNTQGRTWVQLA